MPRPLVRVTIPGLLLVAAFLALPAAAQYNRVFVSARNGNDLSPCNDINTPCKTLQGAVNEVNAGGSVIVLTTGDYGTVSIGKGLTIEAPTGVVAFIHPLSGAGVTVAAGLSDVVVLRGLSLYNGTAEGIYFFSGAVLQVEHCVLNGFNGTHALGFYAAVRHGSSGLLIVKDTIVRNSAIGVDVGTDSTSSTSHAVIEHTRVKGNESGVFLRGGSVATVRGSTIVGNWGTGLTTASFTSGANAELTIEDCLVAYNGKGASTGALFGGTTTVRVSNSTVVYNTVGLSQTAGGSLLSRVNNSVEANTTNTQGAITPYSAK